MDCRGQKIKKFLSAQIVPVLAFLAAAISMIFVPLSAKYFSYLDWRVLILLFCLMAVTAGFQKAGAFSRLAEKLTKRIGNARQLCICLVVLCFFSAMLITNDVALLTFVPFTLLLLREIGQEKCTIYLIVLETAAANLGSMLTPVGNPQNLYLYSKYNFSAGDFFACTLPISVVSLAALLLLCLLVKGEKLQPLSSGDTPVEALKLWAFAGLFLLCILAVFRVIPCLAVLLIVVIALLILDRKLFFKVDYGLLATFLFFFIFVGNLQNIPAVQSFLSEIISGRVKLTAVIASQLLSNVPAAMLLSAFTQEGKELLLGVNIGGLGTPIASLASLISLQLYRKEQSADAVRYLKVFTMVNLALLAVILGFSCMV